MPIRFNPSITVGYARVSTRDQFVKGNALDRYIEDMIESGIEVYFTDVESGGSEDRIGFNAVLEACRKWARVIAVPDFTRFQRSVRLWEKVRPELVALGIEIRDLYTGSPIGFRTADEIRQTQIKTADAEFVRNYAAEQSLRGFERMRKQGRPFKATSGLKIVHKRIIINDDLYRDTGKTYRAIALEYVDIFLERRSLSSAVAEFCDRYGYNTGENRRDDFPRNHNSLKRWLQNPQLRGHQPYLQRGVGHRKSIFKNVHAEPRILYDNHEALFPPELARAIDSALSSCSVGQKVCKPKNPLVGLMFCARCGKEIFLHHCTKKAANGTEKNYNYLYCWGARPMPGDPKVCDRRSAYGLSIEKAIDAVIEAIATRAAEIARWGAEAINENPESGSPEIIELQRAIDTLEALGDPDLAEAINLKKNRLTALRAERRAIGEDRSELIRYLQGKMGDPTYWRSLSVAEQKILFREFVDRIEIDQGTMVVSLRC